MEIYKIFLLLFVVASTRAQIGLRTLPITSRNRTRIDAFSSWPDPEPSRRDPIAASFENELASIFRGVAYGATTDVPTTTTSTTTTAEPFLDFEFPPELENTLSPSSVPVFAPENNDWNGFAPADEEPRPIQHQYIDDNKMEPVPAEVSSTQKPSSSIIKSDFDFRDKSWVVSLGVCWTIYVYTCAGLFTVLAIFSLMCLARLHSLANLNARFYCIIIYLFVFLASFFRSIAFYYAPHNVDARLPSTLASILFNAPNPFTVTSFGILFFMLITTARLRILPVKLQSPLVVGMISCILLVGSLVIDIVCGSLSEPAFVTGLRAAIQALTSGWSGALCIGYVFIYTKIRKAIHRQEREASRLAYTGVPLDGSSRGVLLPYLSHSARATLCASVCGLVLAILQVYGLMHTESLLNLPPSEPWVWFWFQSCSRLLELIVWTAICVGAAFPMENKGTKRAQTLEEGTLLSVFACKSCTSCSNLSECCQESDKTMSEDMYSTLYQSNHIARKFSFQHNGKPMLHDTMASSGPFCQISTTLLPHKQNSGISKSATLRAAPCDMGQVRGNNFSYPSFPRPSSLFLNEKGQVNLYSRGTPLTQGSIRKTPGFQPAEEPYENGSTFGHLKDSPYEQYPRIIENYMHSQIYSDPLPAQDHPTGIVHSSNYGHYQYQHSPSSPYGPQGDQYQVPSYNEYSSHDSRDDARYAPLYQQIPVVEAQSPSPEESKICNRFYVTSTPRPEKPSPVGVHGYPVPHVSRPAEQMSDFYPKEKPVHATSFPEEVVTDLNHVIHPASRGLLRKIVSPTFCSGGYSPLSSDHSNNSAKRFQSVSAGLEDEEDQSDYLSYEESDSPVRRPKPEADPRRSDKNRKQDFKHFQHHTSKSERDTSTGKLSSEPHADKKCSSLLNDNLSQADDEHQRNLPPVTNSRSSSQLESDVNTLPATIDFQETRRPPQHSKDANR